MTRIPTEEKSSVLWSRPAILVSAVLLLGGCASSRPAYDTFETDDAPPTSPDVAEAHAVHDVRRDAVLSAVDSWMGTPYQYGGSTRRGVDCSAFVQSIYRDGLGLRIPRSTEHQREAGTVIDPSAIGFGDLVFFRIGPNQRHVGIVVGPGEFAHSASSSGVTVSSLSEPYWRTRFDRAVRFDERLAMVASSPVVPVPRVGAAPLAGSRRDTERTGW